MRYVLRQAASTLLTLAVVSLLLFVSFELVSGDPATRILGTGATPESLSALRAELGLDQPLPVRYLRWLVSFVQGDPGVSYVYRQPVAELVGSKLPVTLALTLMAFVLTCVMGFSVGILCAKHAGSALDRAAMVGSQAIMAVPAFFAGILISWVFGIVLGLFAPGGYVSYETSIPRFVGYLAFPAIALALPRAAQLAKLLRGAILEEAA